MLDCAWIQIVKRLVFVTCLFAVAGEVAGLCCWIFLLSVNNSSPLGTRESTSNHGVLLNASNPVKGVKYLSIDSIFSVRRIYYL